MADHLVGGLHCADVEDLAASFVLGALEAPEAAAVRVHLAGCPEAHPEFAELGSVAPALLETVELVAPPTALRDRIMAVAAADTQRKAAAADPRMAAAPAPLTVPQAADTQRGGWLGNLFRRPVWAAAAMAAVIAALALGAWNVQLRDELAGLTAYRNGVVEVLDQAGRPGAQLAVLSAPAGGGGPTGLAAVGLDGSVAIVMRDLAPTSGAQVYEAWLIEGTNAPVPIGDFAVGGSRTASFVTAHAPLGTGVTVALTLEAGPGATTPTLPIIALGAARAST